VTVPGLHISIAIVTTLGLISPFGVAMLPAGLCFAYVTLFFKRHPSHSTTGRRIATRIV